MSARSKLRIVAPVTGQKDVTAFPSTTDPSATYLIYLHGRVVENLGPRPTDSSFGLYDYPAILEALDGTGATVISAQRRPNTDVNEYAGLVVSQIEAAIRSGVPPEHIVVDGHFHGPLAWGVLHADERMGGAGTGLDT